MIRRNPITGEPVLFAPERASRPHAFSPEAEDEERCPFCPGHESDTPPTIVQRGDPWRVRVFANRYPPADGAEVIVESPLHDARFEEIRDAAEVVEVWIERLKAHAHGRYASLFRNDGARAGASIPHLHSQLVPLPFLPPRIEGEIDAFRTASACPLCRGIEGETIEENEHWRWIAPAASRLPYQQWLVPTRHVSSLVDLSDRALTDLASMLQDASRATHLVGENQNWLFMNFPERAAHAYIEIVPRMTTIAGLELATGTFVEIIDPAMAAARLRRR